MNQLAPLSASLFPIPSLVVAAGDRARIRFLEFFAANIRNKNTRRAYVQATREFLAWCESAGVASIAEVKPLHVAAYIEQLGRERSAPTVKQRLAAIRHLFDWLVTGQVTPMNPASSVRGPSHSVKRGKTPVLDPAEARALLDSIDVTTPVGLRDRALIGLMVYSFARIGAALAMKVEDVYVQNRRLWVLLHEKGGKRHEMPCHHNLEAYSLYRRLQARDRSEGAAFSNDWPRHMSTDDNPPAPGERLCDDPAARGDCRHRDQNRQSHVSGDWDHGLSQ